MEVKLAREQLLRQFQSDLSGNKPEGDKFQDESGLWAYVDEGAVGSGGLPRIGSVVLANPAAYAAAFEQLGIGPDSEERLSPVDFADKMPKAAIRTGMPPVPPAAPRRDRARLPAVLITKRSSEGTEGLLLGAWSGKLLGDYEFQVFMTRPLYIGGPHDHKPPLKMLHSYPDLGGSMRITPDDLAFGEDYTAAVDHVYGEDGCGSSLRFKFFLGRVRWTPEEEHELLPENGLWSPPARCSRELLLREPDSAFEDPLWAQIVERVGGDMAEEARHHGLLPTEDES